MATAICAAGEGGGGGGASPLHQFGEEAGDGGGGLIWVQLREQVADVVRCASLFPGDESKEPGRAGKGKLGCLAKWCASRYGGRFGSNSPHCASSFFAPSEERKHRREEDASYSLDTISNINLPIPGEKSYLLSWGSVSQ